MKNVKRLVGRPLGLNYRIAYGVYLDHAIRQLDDTLWWPLYEQVVVELRYELGGFVRKLFY